MAKLDEMAIIYNEFCSGPDPIARFLTVYIEEGMSYLVVYFNVFFFILFRQWTFNLIVISPFLIVSAVEGSANSSQPILKFHRSLSDRVAAANRLVLEKNFLGEVVVDTMANEVVDRYDSHPERICIIQDGRVVHDGGNNKFVAYDIDDVIAWLRRSDTRVKSVSTEGIGGGDDNTTGEEVECSS